MIDSVVASHVNNKLEFIGQNMHDMFDDRFSRIEIHLGMKSIGNDKYASTSNTDKTMGGSATGKISANNTIVINSANQHSRTNYNASPNANVPYGAASSLRHSTPSNFAQPTSTPVTNRPNADDVGSGSIKEEVIKIFRQTFGIEPKAKCRPYQRSYPENYDYVAYPQGFKIPEFVKFTGDDSRTTLEHIGQFIIQCGEASTNDIYKLRLFPLSLSGAAFTWFISLPPNSVFTFADLEQNFHDYFFSGETELKLSHLTSVKKKIHECVSEYIRRFRDTRNRCYSLTISNRDLADLAFAG